MRKEKQIGVLGIAFKLRTRTTFGWRPPIEVIRVCWRKAPEVRATDPEAMERAQRGVLPELYTTTRRPLRESRAGADALLVLDRVGAVQAASDWKRVRMAKWLARW